MSGAAMLLALVTCFEGHVAEPEVPGAAAARSEWAPPKRRIVVGFFPGITFGVSPIPSLDVPIFVGGRLGARPWALGIELTFSTGLAERYRVGLVTHRYHLAAMHNFGRRGFAQFGAGAAFLFAYSSPVFEVEARVGRRYGKGRCLLGGLARLGWNYGFRETAPMPQLGVFIGFSSL